MSSNIYQFTTFVILWVDRETRAVYPESRPFTMLNLGVPAKMFLFFLIHYYFCREGSVVYLLEKNFFHPIDSFLRYTFNRLMCMGLLFNKYKSYALPSSIFTT